MPELGSWGGGFRLEIKRFFSIDAFPYRNFQSDPFVRAISSRIRAFGQEVYFFSFFLHLLRYSSNKDSSEGQGGLRMSGNSVNAQVM